VRVLLVTGSDGRVPLVQLWVDSVLVIGRAPVVPLGLLGGDISVGVGMHSSESSRTIECAADDIAVSLD
jgi:hypothetical protein